MTQGHVISDLHLFAERSDAETLLPELGAAAERSSFLVLNGDIFDFRWAIHRSVDESLDAAEHWLDRLVAAHPRCAFHYILGNHDGFVPFVTRLEAIAAHRANLAWHPSHVRLGGSLFLHGDLPLAPRPSSPVARSMEERLGPRGRVRQMAYRAFVAARGHRVIAELHRPELCARRITRRLDEADPALLDGVRDVYFGHTHLAFADVSHAGRRFHNTGATVRGLARHVLPVRPLTPTEIP